MRQSDPFGVILSKSRQVGTRRMDPPIPQCDALSILFNPKAHGFIPWVFPPHFYLQFARPNHSALLRDTVRCSSRLLVEMRKFPPLHRIVHLSFYFYIRHWTFYILHSSCHSCEGRNPVPLTIYALRPTKRAAPTTNALRCFLT